MYARTTIVLLGLALCLTGCAGSPTSSVTVTETATQTATQMATETASQSVIAPEPSSATPVEPTDDVQPVPQTDVITVSDMVGQNYQDAQDVWRASGLIVVPGEDATGANRLPIIDSNWYVVAQEPAGGMEVPNGSSITATVKKYSDD